MSHLSARMFKKKDVILSSIKARPRPTPCDQDAVVPRAKFRRLIAILGLIACASCGRMFDPPLQARFEVTGCEALLAAIDPLQATWDISPVPTIERGPSGEWDAVDLLNPSLVRYGGRYLNLYSGFDGNTWHTGLAVSEDGERWSKKGRVLSPEGWEGDYIAANGAAVISNSEIFYWYQAGPKEAVQIGLARSQDGERWQKHPQPVIVQGPRGSWDETAVGDPYVISCGQWFYMFYLGQNRHDRQRLGLARSLDGIHWQKEHRNPLIAGGAPGSFDTRGVGEPAVFRSGDKFYMLYVGRDQGERRQIGWAESANGVDWRKLENAPRLAGNLDWNRATVCDPEVMVIDDRLHVLFGAGDKAAPDENVNGVIGSALLISK